MAMNTQNSSSRMLYFIDHIKYSIYNNRMIQTISANRVREEEGEKKKIPEIDHL